MDVLRAIDNIFSKDTNNWYVAQLVLCKMILVKPITLYFLIGYWLFDIH